MGVSGKQAVPACARGEDQVKDWDFCLSLGEASGYQAGMTISLVALRSFCDSVEG